jgi:hypothetical protein
MQSLDSSYGINEKSWFPYAGRIDCIIRIVKIDLRKEILIIALKDKLLQSVTKE